MGFGVWGLGVCGLGSQVWVLRFEVGGWGFGSWGLGFGVRVLSFGMWGLRSGVRGWCLGVWGFGVWGLGFSQTDAAGPHVGPLGPLLELLEL